MLRSHIVASQVDVAPGLHFDVGDEALIVHGLFLEMEKLGQYASSKIDAHLDSLRLVPFLLQIKFQTGNVEIFLATRDKYKVLII